MGLFQAFNISASGMTAERFRTDIIAQNIANVNTTSTKEGTPYRRKIVTFSEKNVTPFSQIYSSSKKAAVGNGVKVSSVTSDYSTDFIKEYDPSNPDADADGYVSYPNVNTVTEMTNTVVDPPSIIATHLTEVIRSHIAELLTRQDVQNLVNNLKESNPVIVDELIPKLLGLGEIQKVLQNLLSEGISIRDLLTIFETLADHAQTTRDTDVLTEYVRQGLKRAISSKYFPANETTSVITLDPAVEQEIMSSVKQTEQGSYLSLDPDRIKAIIKSVETEIGKLESLGKSAIIITSPIVRMYFKKMTEDYFKDLIVLSYNEVESNVELQSVGMVTA